MRSRLSIWLTAFALAVAGVNFTAGTATAAGGYCTGSGVNVVVDFGALPGGVQKGCGSGPYAINAFQSAGFVLSRDPAMANYFVCTINTKPTNRECAGTGTQGYWALFVASPHGAWVYASCGADCEPASNGETVAFAWQTPGNMAGGGHRNPAATPASGAAPVPKPTSTPTRKPTTPSAATGIAAGVKAAKSPTAKATARSSGTAKPKKSAGPTPSATASPSTWSSAAPAPSTSAPVSSSSSGGGLPWWIPVGVVALLVVGAGGAWWRKRAGG